MEGFRKLMSKAGSVSDKKSESSLDNSTGKAKLGRFRLKMRMLSNLGGGSRLLQSRQETVTYENTYKTEPEKNKQFSTKKAEGVIESVFQHYLYGKTYDSKVFPRLIKTLSELIRDRVKMQGLERYKIVTVVSIVENKEQGLQMSSRALWNDQFDNYASLAFEGPNYYAVGSVYAIYHD